MLGQALTSLPSNLMGGEEEVNCSGTCSPDGEGGTEEVNCSDESSPNGERSRSLGFEAASLHLKMR